MATKVSSIILRVLVAAAFVIGGALKIWDFPNWKSATPDFFEAVLNFQLLPWNGALALATYLPWLEVLAGLALLGRRAREGAFLLTGAMTLMFLGAIGSAWWRNLDISCGCFGKEVNATDFPVAFTRDAALLAAVVAAWGLEGRPSKPRKRETVG